MLEGSAKPLYRMAVVLVLLVFGAVFWLNRSQSGGGKASPSGPSGSRSGTSSATVETSPSPSAVPVAEQLPTQPLAEGEHWLDLGLPGGTYTPAALGDGTDDYRCIILDPKLTEDTFLTGVVLEPGNGALVHHAILYRADPDQVAAATALDNQDPRLGWSCFGGPGIDGGSGVGGSLDSAPWVSAFATKGGESRFAPGTGQLLKKGGMLILQMHYNLLNGDGPDYTRVRLRVAPSTAQLKQIQTMLMPAPVELPCPSGVTGPLCDRAASIQDVVTRFGPKASFTVSGLQFLCGGDFENPQAGPTQSCTRAIKEPMQINAVAGHMHMLGRKVSIDLIHSDGSKQNLLDVQNWNFDDQRATALAEPVRVGPGDSLKVTCTHDATLRRQIPSLQKLQPRYVVWGEGSSDEMCLGIVSWVKP